MFRIVKTRHAWWPVTWTGVSEDGVVITNKIELRFRLMKIDEFVELTREASAIAHDDANDTARLSAFAEIAALVIEGMPTANPADILAKVEDLIRANVGDNQPAEPEAKKKTLSVAYAEMIQRIAGDWRSVASENGEPLPWTHENIAMLMNEPRVYDRAMEAFREVIEAREPIREGN